MKAHLLAALLTLGAAPAAAQKVESAGGDWSNIPRMKLSEDRQVGYEVVDRLHQIGRKGGCNVPGLTARRVAINVPFLIRFSPSGAAEHIVVQKLGCPEAESLLAGVVAHWVRKGSVRSTGENQERWYRSEIAIESKL